MTHLMVPSHLAAFMTMVVEGVNIDRICRRIECLTVVEATHWIQDCVHAWFRRPCCGEHSAPWRGGSYTIPDGKHFPASASFIDAQKVLFLAPVSPVIAGVVERPEVAIIRKDASSV